ncbi:double-strand break repair helicase AddA [Aliigemmobacter aestuarii]|uniref:DNA 3'-5' helicase n=1 Tax=Aliigemmobacter aestuarii TaxID=1445661 RepID=A0A4S3MVQ9_9RHOB|nr:double-strand break repair helicase AddA [Gemmobacter aestuarii]THD85671.1 double-strand break repair helicase AddA [Gemmobacter aestuarii]
MTRPRPNDATERQIRAADPAQSTWLSANAGSGKTRVLTDRVARLLLDGTDPARILCLTYTKAAATEMQNRLFRTLGEWAMLPDAALSDRLAELGVEIAPRPALLADARRLFARAIETPGGLRIQTIHSFCASLLRRFPLEARISPQFTEMDERAASLMMQEIVTEMAASIAPDLVEDLAAVYSGEDFSEVAQSIVADRAGFTAPADLDHWRARMGLPSGFTAETLLAEVFLGDEASLIAAMRPILLASAKITDARTAENLAALRLDAPTTRTLADLERIVLTGETAQSPYSAKVGSVPTKDTRNRLGALADRFEQLMRRVEAARPRRIALEAAEKSLALHRFAHVFLQEYDRRKANRAALDFDDLIAKAVALLTDPAVAQWVLFRLDGGIDHILVDEAQDTSPQQWRVIELLAREFTAGQGARDIARTVFVVGDKKQSIYSFQGADLQAFDRMQGHFRQRFSEIGQPIQSLDLEYSFRSSPAILDLVDAVFARHSGRGLGGQCHHLAFNSGMPGRVELWPPIPPSGKAEKEEWWDPVDIIGEEHHIARLAREIAEEIGALLAAGVQVPVKGGFRPAHAGDFLILVRRRSPLFSEIIRACKKAGLPIAGADRLKLGGELAVKDLAAVLSVLATPEDDLSLAAALRSPLFGWTEDDLFRLAQGREGYLWQALREKADDHGETMAILTDLRDQADFLRPYDLIERILTRHDGRRKLLARLGAEAEDGMDELLSQALAYERNDVPSLTGFLTWLHTDDVTVKRQMDSVGQQIRVMTVHGAKGLEAPFVILPDTADRTRQERGVAIRLADGTIAWRMPKKASPPEIETARALREDREAEEQLRLLYVALTRAQCRLIVAATGKLSDEMAWYNLVREGMETLGARTAADGRLVHETGAWPTGTPAAVADARPEAPLPEWARRKSPDSPRPPRPLSPSDLGGAKVMPGETDGSSEESMKRGTRLHLLLEHLPDADPAEWPALARRLLEDAPDSDDLLAEARPVLMAPHLAPLFKPGTLAEVAVTAEFEGQRLSGTIDRLVVEPERVLAVDFKSNRIVPDKAQEVPDGIRRQLAAYAAALAQIYPDRRIEVAVLWTRTATLMPVPV